MGAPRGLTPTDVRALRSAVAELCERQGWTRAPERARAIRLIGDWVDRETAAPLVFRMDRKGWRIGIGEGERVSPPSDAIGEAIYTLHAAVANPFDSQPLINTNLNTARIRATRARQFIRKHCAVLADLLEHIEVTRDDTGQPVATYRPLAESRSIETG